MKDRNMTQMSGGSQPRDAQVDARGVSHSGSRSRSQPRDSRFTDSCREMNQRSRSHINSHWKADSSHNSQPGCGSRSRLQPRGSEAAGAMVYHARCEMMDSRSKSQPRSWLRVSAYYENKGVDSVGHGISWSRRSTGKSARDSRANEDAYCPKESRRISRGDSSHRSRFSASPFGAPTRVNDARKENVANISIERIYSYLVPDTSLHTSNQGALSVFFQYGN